MAKTLRDVCRSCRSSSQQSRCPFEFCALDRGKAVNCFASMYKTIYRLRGGFTVGSQWRLKHRPFLSRFSMRCCYMSPLAMGVIVTGGCERSLNSVMLTCFAVSWFGPEPRCRGPVPRQCIPSQAEPAAFITGREPTAPTNAMKAAASLLNMLSPAGCNTFQAKPQSPRLKPQSTYRPHRSRRPRLEILAAVQLRNNQKRRVGLQLVHRLPARRGILQCSPCGERGSCAQHKLSCHSL